MPRKDCSINERMKDLENAVPVGESIGPLPPGFKAIPDPELIQKITSTFKTLPVGEIPPDESLGLILQDGRIVVFGDFLGDFHNRYLEKIVKPSKEIGIGPEAAYQEVINATGTILYRLDRDGMTLEIYRPISSAQKRGVLAINDALYESTSPHKYVLVKDGFEANFDEFITSFKFSGEPQLKTALTKIKNNPPSEWDSIIDATKKLNQNLDNDIRMTSDELLRSEGEIANQGDKVVILDGPDEGLTGTLLNVRKNAAEVHIDGRPEGDIRSVPTRTIARADAVTGLPEGVSIQTTDRAGSVVDNAPVEDVGIEVGFKAGEDIIPLSADAKAGQLRVIRAGKKAGEEVTVIDAQGNSHVVGDAKKIRKGKDIPLEDGSTIPQDDIVRIESAGEGKWTTPAEAGGIGGRGRRPPTAVAPEGGEEAGRNIEDLTPDEWASMVLEDVEGVKPLTADAVKILRQVDEGKKLTKTMTPEEVNKLRKIAESNGIATSVDSTADDLVIALRNRAEAIKSVTKKPSKKLTQAASRARKAFNEAKKALDAARESGDQNKYSAAFDDYNKAKAERDKAEAALKQSPIELAEEVSKVPEKDRVRLLEEADELRRKGRVLLEGLHDPTNKTSPHDRLEEAFRLFSEADGKSAEAGLPRTISSITGEFTSAEKKINEIDSLLAKRGKDKVTGARRTSLKAKRDWYSRQVKAHYDRVGESTKRVEELRDKVERAQRTYKKSRTAKNKTKLDNLKADLEFEELTLMEDLSGRTAVEQLKALEDAKAKAFQMLNSDLPNDAMRKFWGERIEVLDRAIAKLEADDAVVLLKEEQGAYMDELVEAALKRNGEEFRLLENGIREIDREIDEIKLYRLDAADSGKRLVELYNRKKALVKRGMELRNDAYSAVEVLLEPLEGSGRYLNLDDMTRLAPARGWIGRNFEKALNKKFESIPILKETLRVARSVVGAIDNSFVLGGDEWGRRIIGLKKLENYALMQSIEDANKLGAFGNMPFKLNAKGMSEKTGVPVNDMMENWAKYRDQFGEREDEYVTLVNNIRRRTQDFLESQGHDIPDVWRQLDTIFRDVTHVVQGERVYDINEIMKRAENIRAGKTAKPDSMKMRVYETVLDGYENGIRYETDVSKVMIQKVTALRKWAVHEAFLKKWAAERGQLKSLFVAQELRTAVDVASTNLNWADDVLNFAKASDGAYPRKLTLRNTDELDVPKRLREIRDEVDKLNKRKITSKFTKTDKNNAVKKLKEEAQSIRNKFAETDRLAKYDLAEETGKIGRHIQESGARWGKKGEVIVDSAPVQWTATKDKLFLIDDIKYMERHYGNIDNWFVNALNRGATAVSTARILQTGADFGFWFINGLPLLGHDLYSMPARNIFHPLLRAAGFNVDSGIASGSTWGKTMWNSLVAMTNKKATAKWWVEQARKYPEQWARFKKHGRIGSLPHEYGEFGIFERLEAKLPGTKQLALFHRFQRTFSNYLSTASWEYWKSLDHLAKTPDELEQLGAMSRNIIGIHAGQELGIHAGQLGVERLLFYAPSFTRASFAIMANAAFQGNTFAGRQALKSIAGLTAAMTMVVGAYSFATQMEENGWDFSKLSWDDLVDDVKEAWTPGANFWGVRIGDGFVGLGGSLRSNTQLLFRLMGEGINWNPSFDEPLHGFELELEKLFPTDFDHPFPRWFRGKGSILAGNVWNVATGEDYLGYANDGLTDPTWIYELAPFWMQAAFEARGMGIMGRLGVAATEIGGLRYVPITPYTAWKEAAEEATGMSWDDLNEETPGADGKPRKIHGRIINDLKNNFPPADATKEQKEAWDYAYRKYLEYEEDSRKRAGDIQAYRDESREIAILQDREIANWLDRIDGSVGSGVIPAVEIGKIYEHYDGATQELRKLTFGEDEEETKDILDEAGILSLHPVAQLAYALEIENWRDPVTFEINWDARDKMIEDSVAQLEPADRAAWERGEGPNLGIRDVENFQAGYYDAANAAMARKKKAGEDLRAMDEVSKYKGLTKEEGEKVDELLELTNMVRQSFEITGRDFDRRDILRNILSLFPDNRIVATALIATYPALSSVVRSKEREEILLNNPDVAVFYPWILNQGFSDDFREDYEEKWGFGQNVWPKSQLGFGETLSERLARLDEEKDKENEDSGLLGLGLGPL